jgi:hypothetical protein
MKTASPERYYRVPDRQRGDITCHMQVCDYTEFNMSAISPFLSLQEAVTTFSSLSRSEDRIKTRLILISFLLVGVGIAQSYSDGLRARWSRFDSQQGQEIILFSKVSRPALEPSIRVPGALSTGVKQHGREADHSLPSSAEVKNGGALHPLSHTSSWRKIYLYLRLFYR